MIGQMFRAYPEAAYRMTQTGVSEGTRRSGRRVDSINWKARGSKAEAAQRQTRRNRVTEGSSGNLFGGGSRQPSGAHNRAPNPGPWGDQRRRACPGYAPPPGTPNSQLMLRTAQYAAVYQPDVRAAVQDFSVRIDHGAGRRGRPWWGEMRTNSSPAGTTAERWGTSPRRRCAARGNACARRDRQGAWGPSGGAGRAFQSGLVDNGSWDQPPGRIRPGQTTASSSDSGG